MLVILLSNEEQRHDAEALVHRMVKRAVELEGTVTVSFIMPASEISANNN